MKKKILLVFIVLFAFTVCGQTVEDIGKIVIGVNIENSSTTETLESKDYLNNKLQSLIVTSGFATNGLSSLYLSPNIIISSCDKVEAGMKDLYVTKGVLYIVVKGNDNVIFEVIELPFNGSGTDRSKALKNGIQKINFQAISNTLLEAKGKMLHYYESKKDIVFSKADAYVVNGQFDEAITCLAFFPEELGETYIEAMTKAAAILNMRDSMELETLLENIRAQNNIILNDANRFIAMHKPLDALEVLWGYEPGEVDQDAQYESIVNKAESLLSVEEQRQMAIKEKEYQDAKERERYKRQVAEKERLHQNKMEYEREKSNQMKINAIKQIACEYLKNNPVFNLRLL